MAAPSPNRTPAAEDTAREVSDGMLLAMTQTGAAGTPLWTAPEVTRNQRHGLSKYGPPADMYSFGLVLYEVATRRLPFETHGSALSLFRLREMVEEGKRPTILDSDGVPPALQRVMEAAWVGDPASRPTFQQMTSALQAVASKLAEPLEPLPTAEGGPSDMPPTQTDP